MASVFVACQGNLSLDESGADPVVSQVVLALDLGAEADAEIPVIAEVGTAHEFRFRLTAGPEGLPAGAKMRIRVPGTFADPQYTSATREGHVTAHSSVEESLSTAAWLDVVDGHLTGTEGWWVESVLGEPLSSGQTVDLVYGDTSGGSIGSRVSFLARPAFSFPVSLDSDGDGEFTSLAVFSVQTFPGLPVTIRVAPSATARAGQAVKVQAAAFDLLGNPAEGVEGALACTWTRGEATAEAGTLALNAGELEGEIGETTFTAPEEPGPWRLACTHASLSVTVLNVTLVREAAGMYFAGGAGGESWLFWGDLHIHSSISNDAGADSEYHTKCCCTVGSPRRGSPQKSSQHAAVAPVFGSLRSLRCDRSLAALRILCDPLYGSCGSI